MNSRFIAVVAIAAAFAFAGVDVAAADEGGLASRTEVSVLGGFQALNSNNTALPDRFIDIPAVGAVTYHFTPNLAAEGEFTWIIPIKQSVDLGSGVTQDRKTPNILAYQANVRGSWPLSGWTPYLTGGLGAVTFLSNTGADRLPQLDGSQTAFAINFGTGASYDLGPHWALRGDFRELAAFPSKDAAGLSSSGKADAIWMERGAVGLAYRF